MPMFAHRLKPGRVKPVQAAGLIHNAGGVQEATAELDMSRGAEDAERLVAEELDRMDRMEAECKHGTAHHQRVSAEVDAAPKDEHSAAETKLPYRIGTGGSPLDGEHWRRFANEDERLVAEELDRFAAHGFLQPNNLSLASCLKFSPSNRHEMSLEAQAAA